MDCAARKKINRIKEDEEGEDRISRLPDELIHHVLSFLDNTGLAVQTCLLSTRWKNVRKSLPHLTFKFNGFGRTGKREFFKLVNRTISGRYHTSHVSTIRFNSGWSISPHLYNKLLKYAFSHGIQHLYISETGWCDREKTCLIPISTFSSQSLKHLTLGVLDETCLEITTLETLSAPQIRTTWNLPNLTTLCLFNLQLGLSSNSRSTDENGRNSVDIFSNLVHLKDLTLVRCAILDLDAPLSIISISLKRLYISNLFYRRQSTCMYIVLTPNITSLKCELDYPLILYSTEQLSCLTEATIELWRDEYKIPVEELLELFSLARNAKLLTISVAAVDLLSGAPELLRNRASPLGNLQRLTIKVLNKSPAPITKDVITYFLNSSPNASIETMSESGRRTKLH